MRLLSHSIQSKKSAERNRDGNIRYFEYQNDKFETLSEYKSGDPQRGIAFLPKRGVNVHENEVMRAFKTVNDSYIEPISFIVPRRAEVFQDDIYPPATGLKAAMSSSDWFNGAEGFAPKIDLAAIYAGEEPTEVPSDYKTPARDPSPKAASPTKKAPEPEPTSQPTSSLKGPPPSMNEQTASIKDLASKFNDDDEADSADDASSFEEVPKPVDRPTHQQPQGPTPNASTAPSQPSPPTTTSRTPGSALSPVNKPDDFSQASQVAANQSTASQIKTQSASLGESRAEPLAEQLPTSPAEEARGTPRGGEVQASLAEIKSLLQQQTKTMSAQNETIGKLTKEVEVLRGRMGEM